MSTKVSAFVRRRLNEWGLTRAYGYPGDGVGGWTWRGARRRHDGHRAGGEL